MKVHKYRFYINSLKYLQVISWKLISKKNLAIFWFS